MDLSERLAFAEATVREAGELTLRYFQKGSVRTEFKDDDSPVTVADREAEQLIRDRIASAYPDDIVVGEEFGGTENPVDKAAHRWIVDPIDGTKSFVRGVPLYGVLLALEAEGRSRVGCAYFPALQEMVSGAEGVGAFWNGNPCQVSSEDRIERAFCAHYDAAYIERSGKGEAWKRLRESVYYNAGWCDAYGYLLVATGRVEVMFDAVVSIWDCAPFPPILKEAGGYFGDWKGNEGVIDAGEALATNAALKDEVVRLLA